MPVRLALISFSCLSVVSCSANTALQPPSNIKIPENIKQTTDKLIGDKKQWINANTSRDTDNSNRSFSNKASLIDNNEFQKDAFTYQNVPNASISSSNYMTLERTTEKNALGNPLYKLYLYVDRKSVGEFRTVTGRANTQDKNRHRAGTQAPLPDGQYKVDTQPIRATIAEAGKLFLPIEPLFRTGRTSLGIHYDPSFEKNNGEDGTSGCIGLTSEEDLKQVLDYVQTYQPEYLKVNI